MNKRSFAYLILAVAWLLLPASSMANAQWTIKLAHDHRLSSPHHAAALMIKEKLEKESNGEIEVEIYPNQILGTGSQMVEMMQAGAIQMVGTVTSQVEPFHPPLQVLSLPFLFKSPDEFYKNLDGEFGEALFEPLQKRNINVLTVWESGLKQFTSNTPIHWPEDFEGQKMRIMPSAIIREQFSALGASPVPVDFSELYNALQQGVVDGQENPLVGIVPLKLYEVQKYLTMSNHAWIGYALMINNSFLESLPEEYRELVIETAEESRIFEVDLVRKQNSDYMKTIKEAGMTVIELSDEQVAAFRDQVQPVYDWFSQNVPDADRYLKMLNQ